MEFGKCTKEECNNDGDPIEPRKRTSCTILTGFLGSGKTTLINHILDSNNNPNNTASASTSTSPRRPRPLRIAIIENEYGEVGIDDALVLQTEEEVFEMNNGCICCTVRGDLLRVFQRLSKRHKPFDHILIETTGLADPAPVAQTFFVDDEVKSNYELDGIITVVDCKHVLPHLEEVKPIGVENESVEQVAFADKILLNKIDLVTHHEKATVIDKIRSINKFAELIEVQHSQVDPSRILGVKAFDLARVLQVEEDFLDTEGEHQHDESVTSVGIEFDGQLDLALLNSWLSKMLRENGVDLFRSKGVLNIAGSDARYIFQGVHMLMGISSSADGIGRGWKVGEKRTNRLVFIGRNLVREDILANFKACVVKS